MSAAAMASFGRPAVLITPELRRARADVHDIVLSDPSLHGNCKTIFTRMLRRCYATGRADGQNEEFAGMCGMTVATFRRYAAPLRRRSLLFTQRTGRGNIWSLTPIGEQSECSSGERSECSSGEQSGAGMVISTPRTRPRGEPLESFKEPLVCERAGVKTSIAVQSPLKHKHDWEGVRQANSRELKTADDVDETDRLQQTHNANTNTNANTKNLFSGAAAKPILRGNAAQDRLRSVEDSPISHEIRRSERLERAADIAEAIKNQFESGEFKRPIPQKSDAAAQRLGPKVEPERADATRSSLTPDNKSYRENPVATELRDFLDREIWPRPGWKRCDELMFGWLAAAITTADALKQFRAQSIAAIERMSKPIRGYPGLCRIARDIAADGQTPVFSDREREERRAMAIQFARSFGRA